jgi:hypothetical protein
MDLLIFPWSAGEALRFRCGFLLLGSQHRLDLPVYLGQSLLKLLHTLIQLDTHWRS